MFKCVLKWNLPISSDFSFIIINVKTLLNFEKEWCTLIMKNDVWKKNLSYDSCFEYAKGLLKHYQFASSFQEWSFINNET